MREFIRESQRNSARGNCKGQRVRPALDHQRRVERAQLPPRNRRHNSRISNFPAPVASHIAQPASYILAGRRRQPFREIRLALRRRNRRYLRRPTADAARFAVAIVHRRLNGRRQRHPMLGHNASPLCQLARLLPRAPRQRSHDQHGQRRMQDGTGIARKKTHEITLNGLEWQRLRSSKQ